jgi:hypothetical protein
MTPNQDDPQMWNRVIKWWEDPDHNPRHMDEDLLEWVLTHYPKWIKMKVNRAYFEAEIAKLKAQGIEVTPELFAERYPGLKFIFKTRLKGYGDPSVN